MPNVKISELPAATTISGTEEIEVNQSGTSKKVTAQQIADLGGVSYEVGQVVLATEPPTTGTWLETGRYYSKATYPALASVVGNVPDIGAFVLEPQATLPVAFSTLAAPGARYVAATDGTTIVLGGNGGNIRKSTNGIDWAACINPFSLNIREVRYLNGNFIVVPVGGAGSNGAVLLRSTDGTNFNASYTGLPTSTGHVVSVAFGSGRYVCINGTTSSGVAYSTDLINWTVGSFPTIANTINRVIFANSLFVAVGSSSCFTSSDGITWTSRTIPSGTYTDVIYANGLYVAYGSSIISTSSDGVTWTSRFTGAVVNQVIYDNSLFVAVCGNGAIQTSTDGLTWTAQTSGTTLSLNGVCWNSTNYVAVGNNGRFLTSPDGTTWTVNVDASLSTFNQVSVVAGKTVAFGASASVVLAGAARSTPLLSGAWAFAVSTTSAPNPRPIAYNGSNQYVVGGDNGWVLTSADGSSWTGRHSGVSTTINGVFYLNGNYIGVGGSGLNTNLVTSADGVSWTVRTAASGATFNAAAFGASTYVVVGTSVQYSTDLVTWTVGTGFPLQAFNDVIFANGLFVAVGTSGAVATSPDGVTWTSQSAGSTQLNRIIYDNSLFVAVGNTGVIYTSADGVTWTLRASGVVGNLNDVAWSGSVFCAVGATGNIVTSPDGITWTSRQTADGAVTLMSVAWSGTRFIITNGTNTGVWTSTDGTTWTRVFEAAPNTNPTRRTSYLGGRFISVGTGGWVQTSTDGLSWRVADDVQYVPSFVTRLLKLGSFYYALTDSGAFQSSDGIAFAPIREIPAGPNARGVAYDGTSWVMACTQTIAGLPAATFKSTNGTTWVKSAELFTTTSRPTATINGIGDCVYAGGNFVFSIQSVVSGTATINNGVFTSSDAVTWTYRMLPFSSAIGSAAMATDGTVILAISGNPSGAYRSDDGGVTWSPFIAALTQALGYSDSVWVASNFITTNLGVLNGFPLGLASFINSGYYVYDSKLLYLISSATSRYMLRADSAGVILYSVPATRQLSYGGATNAKPYPVRGSTLMVPYSGSSAVNPFLIAECPLYSYSTTTTFWVPPQTTGGGQTAYIYAGA